MCHTITTLFTDHGRRHRAEEIPEDEHADEHAHRGVILFLDGDGEDVTVARRGRRRERPVPKRLGLG